MKFTCQRDSMLTAVQQVSAALAARTTKPILSCIKAVAEDDSLTLTAQDMECGVRAVIRGVTVQQAGAAILACPQLPNILRESQDAEVSLTANDDGATVKIGASKFTLPAYSVAEFPDLPTEGIDSDHIELSAGDLLRVIENVAWAADKKDSTRFALSGTLLEVAGAAIRGIATDSKRLAVCEAKLGEGAAKKVSALIPAKAVALLSKNLTDHGELVQVAMRPNKAIFQTDRVLIYTRLVEGRYPPYLDILKQTSKQTVHKIPLVATVFLQKVRQASVMTDDESKRLNLSFSDGVCTLSAKGAELGSSHVEMPVEFQGSAKISFDPSFVVSMLRNAGDADTVEMEMADESKPALFHCGENTRVLIMPLAG